MFSFANLQDAKAADHNDDKGHLAHQRAILEEAEVVCSTCAGADHPVLQGKDFGCVLIDEAGQTTELAVLVPLMKMRKDGVATLVGDHRQLPPTISNVEVDVEGLGTSLFERLSSHGVEPFMLDIQYRIPALNFLLVRTDFVWLSFFFGKVIVIYQRINPKFQFFWKEYLLLVCEMRWQIRQIP